MALLVLGINHRTASLEVRERVAFAPQELAAALRDACRRGGVREIAILSTCNRTELYAVTDATGCRALCNWLCDFHRIDAQHLRNCTYDYWDEAAARHMMRVASGLDSMVLGEPQILGQLKDAYADARSAGTVTSELGRLFEQTFAVAKRVRTETAIGENPVSVAYAAVSMARHIFADLRQNTALLIGAGKTIELVARHLREVGVRNIVIANRTLTRAQGLASQLDGKAIALAEIPEHLHLADIVIASTASELPILGKGAVERALKRRRHKPMLMVDIAVPRDIEPEVAQLSDVFLYTVDDLKQVIDENIKTREGAAREAEHLVESGAAEFMRQRRALDSVSVLKQFRGDAEAWRDAEVEKALRALRNGSDAEALLRNLGRSLTNKLLHNPTVQVRKATAEGRGEAADWLRELYQLPLPAADSSASEPRPEGVVDAVVVPFVTRASDG